MTNPANMFRMIGNPDHRLQFQVNRWYDGQSLHNHIDNQCCPDYSCCYPALVATSDCKHAFRKAVAIQDEDLVAELVMNFEAALRIAQGIQIAFEDCPEDVNAYH